MSAFRGLLRAMSCLHGCCFCERFPQATHANIVLVLEEAALADPYFQQRKLYPNVDFYSWIIYRALGIPTPMFTVMFALGRLPGWIAQWREMRVNGDPIGRPRQVYTGYQHRDYVPIENR